MTDIEQRARELLKAALQERYPDDVATRYVIKQLETDSLDLVSCRAAVAAIAVALRAAPEPAPTIDLGQFREAVEMAMEVPLNIAQRQSLQRLLALIDGQAQPFNGELRPDDLAVESWPPQTGLLLGLPRGIKVTHKPTGTMVTCDTERSQHANRDRAMAMLRAKLQPTKSEEESDGQ